MLVSDAINNFNNTTITGSDKHNFDSLVSMLDKRFKDKLEIINKINKEIKFWNAYLKDCHIDLRNHTKGQVCAFKKILKVLEE